MVTTSQCKHPGCRTPARLIPVTPPLPHGAVGDTEPCAHRLGPQRPLPALPASPSRGRNPPEAGPRPPPSPSSSPKDNTASPFLMARSFPESRTTRRKQPILPRWSVRDISTSSLPVEGLRTELGGDPGPRSASSEETGSAQHLEGGQRCQAPTAAPIPGPRRSCAAGHASAQPGGPRATRTRLEGKGPDRAESAQAPGPLGSGAASFHGPFLPVPWTEVLVCPLVEPTLPSERAFRPCFSD